MTLSQGKAACFAICFASVKAWWKFRHQYINLDITVSRASDYLNCQWEPFGPRCIRSQESKDSSLSVAEVKPTRQFCWGGGYELREVMWTGRISSDDEID